MKDLDEKRKKFMEEMQYEGNREKDGVVYFEKKELSPDEREEVFFYREHLNRRSEISSYDNNIKKPKTTKNIEGIYNGKPCIIKFKGKYSIWTPTTYTRISPIGEYERLEVCNKNTEHECYTRFTQSNIDLSSKIRTYSEISPLQEEGAQAFLLNKICEKIYSDGRSSELEIKTAILDSVYNPKEIQAIYEYYQDEWLKQSEPSPSSIVIAFANQTNNGHRKKTYYRKDEQIYAEAYNGDEYTYNELIRTSGLNNYVKINQRKALEILDKAGRFKPTLEELKLIIQFNKLVENQKSSNIARE